MQFVQQAVFHYERMQFTGKAAHMRITEKQLCVQDGILWKNPRCFSPAGRTGLPKAKGRHDLLRRNVCNPKKRGRYKMNVEKIFGTRVFDDSAMK